MAAFAAASASWRRPDDINQRAGAIAPAIGNPRTLAEAGSFALRRRTQLNALIFQNMPLYNALCKFSGEHPAFTLPSRTA